VYHLLDWSHLRGESPPPRLYELDPAFSRRLTLPGGAQYGNSSEGATPEDPSYVAAASTERNHTASEQDDGCVISLGSFSKILAPGLRLGWIEASPSLIRRIKERGYVVSGGSVAPFVSEVVAEMLEPEAALKHQLCGASSRKKSIEACGDGDNFDGECSAHVHLQRLIHDYCLSCDVLVRALKKSAGELELVAEPSGGFFAWVRLPQGLSADRLLPIAERYGVVFLPGRACAPSCPPGTFDRYVRLCFALEEASEIEEGIKRLATAVREALATS